MAGARFLLAQGPMLRGEADEPLAARRGRSPRAVDLPGDGAVWTGWLLLGGNNRELGRGSVLFDGIAACQAALAELARAAESLRTVITADLDVSSWRWRAEDESGPVAVGGRLYQRRRECAYALNQFLSALPSAEVQPGPPRLLGLSWTDWSRPGESALRRRGATAPRGEGGPSPLRHLAR